MKIGRKIKGLKTQYPEEFIWIFKEILKKKLDDSISISSYDVFDNEVSFKPRFSSFGTSFFCFTIDKAYVTFERKEKEIEIRYKVRFIRIILLSLVSGSFGLAIALPSIEEKLLIAFLISSGAFLMILIYAFGCLLYLEYIVYEVAQRTRKKIFWTQTTTIN